MEQSGDIIAQGGGTHGGEWAGGALSIHRTIDIEIDLCVELFDFLKNQTCLLFGCIVHLIDLPFQLYQGYCWI